MVWVFWPRGMWDLSSLAGMNPAPHPTPTLEGQVPTTEVPMLTDSGLMAFEKKTCLMKKKSANRKTHLKKIKRSFLESKTTATFYESLSISSAYHNISTVSTLPAMRLPKWKWRQTRFLSWHLSAACWASPTFLASLKIWFPYPCTSLTGVWVGTATQENRIEVLYKTQRRPAIWCSSPMTGHRPREP